MMPTIFGVRHLSPGGAHHLLRLLDDIRPALILIEGPSDLSSLIPSICLPKTILPIAMMAYSETVPIRTILYPFAVYSPEYQAIRWAHKHKTACRFMDLPASVFLALRRQCTDEEADCAQPDGKSLYTRLAERTNEPDQESWWERHFEHNLLPSAYAQGARAYGQELRLCSEDGRDETAQTLVREAHMKREIERALSEGFAADKIVAVTGAYHVAGLETCAALTDAQLDALPRVPCKHTLMPYSYARLTFLSGYGAGNKAPAYYETLWQAMQEGDLKSASYQYLSRIAEGQRKYGNWASSAEVIEAVRLADTLAALKNAAFPTLQDLRDSAMTCMGHGQFSEIALAVAAAEVGTAIGSLPAGVSRTSIQEDFYQKLKELRLEKYKTLIRQNLDLDLRENTRVKSEKSAFIDLNRSFFLHRMEALGIHFAEKQKTYQEKATWSESWLLAWQPEAEIEIVESALKGDTIELAAAFVFHDQLAAAQNIAETAAVIEIAWRCGMPRIVNDAISALQSLTIDAASVGEIAATVSSLSAIIRYGTIRKIDPAPLEPLLAQLFYRACLLLPDAAGCDDKAASAVIEAMKLLNEAAIHHEILHQEAWLHVLNEIAERDDLNTKASGFATAILLERGKMDNEHLGTQVSRRLSRSIPADLGAGWFEGLALKNRYALIARLSLWEQLEAYINELDDEDFRRALVFLRRAFADFSAQERAAIGENLGQLWNADRQNVSEALSATLNNEEKVQLNALGDFDFGDI